MDEFSLIKKYFHNQENQSFAKEKGIILGIGDDAAVFESSPDHYIVSSMDTLIAGVHFPEDCLPEDVAYKALAVNLSDLAAMGASPHSFTLSLSLPEVNELWLEGFSKTLFALANFYKCVLIGGDTCRGKLSITIQINGTVSKPCFLSRAAMKEDDYLCVTGYLGLAALGLFSWRNNLHDNTEALQRFYGPPLKLEFAQALWSLGVRSAIDISDGLLSELKHLCVASQVSVCVDSDALLVHKELSALPLEQQKQFMLSGGDDYELCFSVNAAKLEAVKDLARTMAIPLSVFGRVQKQSELLICDMQGKPLATHTGYLHF